MGFWMRVRSVLRCWSAAHQVQLPQSGARQGHRPRRLSPTSNSLLQRPSSACSNRNKLRRLHWRGARQRTDDNDEVVAGQEAHGPQEPRQRRRVWHVGIAAAGRAVQRQRAPGRVRQVHIRRVGCAGSESTCQQTARYCPTAERCAHPHWWCAMSESATKGARHMAHS